MVDGIPFPPQLSITKSLFLLGHGITDIEIHFLQIKFTAIGVYLDPEIVSNLQKWKGKPGNELAEDDDFFEALISAPVDKFLRVVVIKEIKGSQYGVQLENAVRDRLAAVDKYEEEEEEALEQLVNFFQSKYFKKDSILTFYFPAASPIAECYLFARTMAMCIFSNGITTTFGLNVESYLHSLPFEIVFASEGKEDSKIEVKNANVVEMIQKWYLGGTRGISPTTISSIANALSAELSK